MLRGSGAAVEPLEAPGLRRAGAAPSFPAGQRTRRGGHSPGFALATALWTRTSIGHQFGDLADNYKESEA